MSLSLNQAVFLDSGTATHTNRHTDIFSAEPIKVFSVDTHTNISYNQQLKQFCDSIYTQIAQTREENSAPFSHGLIGFMSYDAGETAELKPTSEARTINDSIAYPTHFVGFYAWSYVYNHATQKGLISFSPFCNPALRKKILDCVKTSGDTTNNEHTSTHPLSHLNWSKSQLFQEYSSAFKRIQTYIRTGDCYQVNLTQRFEAKSTENAVDLYFSTREHVQTPYSCLFSFSHTQHLLSFSPEQFISSHNRTIESKPIKGTIENNGTDENKQHLLDSTKNQAENLMIVDLLRNDLGKVCQPGSIQVPELFKIESYKNVHHLVSHITGKLKDDVSELDAFLSCFPGGSITGAPKIRSMEIIRELEKHSRSAYCGSVFYLNANGDFDSNILIRSVIKSNEHLFCWAGGGIVADSELLDEYQESLTKVSNITGLHQ